MFEIGKDVKIHPSARIHVKHGFIGDRSVIGEHAVIEGFHVEIGAEAWIFRYADIGGGSSFDPQAKLVAGDFLHMGLHSHINFALPVQIGHEFGCGIETKIFSHGAYLSAWEGFPVQWRGVTIGDRVWMPNAWVNPGVTVGSDVVVAARSLVRDDVPAGSLVGGIPSRVIRSNAYPKKLSPDEKQILFGKIFDQARNISGENQFFTQNSEDVFLINGECAFDLGTRMIIGKSSNFSELLKNQLRRNGIRFRFHSVRGEYAPWESNSTTSRDAA